MSLEVKVDKKLEITGWLHGLRACDIGRRGGSATFVLNRLTGTKYRVLRHGALMHDNRSARTARGLSRREVDDQGLPSSGYYVPAETRQFWLDSLGGTKHGLV